MLYILVRNNTMCSTWGKYHEKTIRIRRGCSIYYIRHWLRLLVVQPIMSSYPWPFSMLSSGGINHNISSNNQTSVIHLDKISHNIWFDIFEQPIDVGYMFIQHGHKPFCICWAHQYNDFFSWKTFSCHVNL